MKTIYLTHSRSHDYKKELYKPIRESELNKNYNFILPHEKSEEIFNTKKLFNKGCDILIAECTHPKIGIGIEIGWANNKEIKIITIYKKGTKLSESMKELSKEIIEYKNSKDMINKIKFALEKI